MKMFSTAVLRRLALGALMAFAGSAAGQPAYPNKPIRFIIPFAPGGGTNIVTRLVTQKLTEDWGQQVIIDNRPGGNSIIGSEALAKSTPDGYTVMVTVNTFVSLPLLQRSVPFDVIKDFAPVGTLAGTEYLLVLHPSVPANKLQEVIALAKSKPGQLNYGSVGSGGPSHLAGALFQMMTGVTMQQVPYKGAGPALTDLVGGQIQLLFSPPANALQFIRAGRLKTIAITGETRLLALPQVPTFAEAGLPGFEMKAWWGVLAPAGTAKAIIDKLSAEFAKILALPDIREKLASQDIEPYITTPERFGAVLRADMAKFAKIIKAAGIKPEN